ncbi:MAG TPA: hypothetical protein VIV60_14125 [Polyangiaceae bacterium]
MLHRYAWLVIICSHAVPCRASPLVTSAQSPSSPEPGTPEPTTTDAAEASNATASVEQRYAAALERYRAGDLLSALQLQLECFEATHSPNLLFNIAQLYRELKDCVKAVEFYQRYLVAAEDGERRVDAERYVLELRPQCPTTVVTAPLEQRPAPLSSVTTAGEVRVHATKTSNTLGWVALGVGALATSGAVYAALETNRAKDDVEYPKRNHEGAVEGDFVAHRQDDFYSARAWAFGLGSLAVLSTGLGIYAFATADHVQGSKSKRGNARPTSLTLSGVATARLALVGCSWQF